MEIPQETPPSDITPKRASQPHQSLRQALDWARWLASLALTLVILYSVVCLLQIVQKIPNPLIPFSTVEVNIEEGISKWTVISGHTLPNYLVEVGSNTGLLGRTVSLPNGEFRVEVSLPPQTTSIYAQVLQPGSLEVVASGGKALPFSLAFTPTLQTAIFISDTHQLWAAGWAPVGEVALVDNEGEHLYST